MRSVYTYASYGQMFYDGFCMDNITRICVMRMKSILMTLIDWFTPDFDVWILLNEMQHLIHTRNNDNFVGI